MVKTYQVEEAEEMTTLDLAKFRKAQPELEETKVFDPNIIQPEIIIGPYFSTPCKQKN